MKGNSIQKKLISTLRHCGTAACVLGATVAAKASVVVITNPADVAAFLAGTTTETFDDLSALAVTSYAAADATGHTFSSRNAATSPTFDSGGATPSNPASNPGIPVGIVAPGGGIAGDVKSGSNVAGPINVAPPPLDVFSPNAFMEIAFPQGKDATKVGFWVTHGTVNVNVQDDSLSALDSTVVSAGSFVAFTRGAAEIRNVGLTSGSGAFTIDDFSYAYTSSSTGGTGGTGGGSSVPDSGSMMNLALAATSLGLLSWRGRGRKA